MIKTLTVGNTLGDESSKLPPSAPPKIEHRSTLKSFTVHIIDDFSSELDILLPCCPELMSFACNITLHDPYYPSASPFLFSQTLSHCRKTPSTLQLNYDCPGTVDDTFADLSCLGNLKTLKASSEFLFDWDARMDPVARKGLHTRLPSSLQTLKV